MKYSIYQMDIIAGKPDANRMKVRHWLEAEMEENKPDIIVLPEMWTTAYTLTSLDKVADRDGAKTKSFLKELAMNFNVNIIGGSVANQKDGKYYNSSFVFSRTGDLVYEYDKVHLVPMLKEHEFLAGGATVPEVFELEGIKMGLIICYDLRFPEIIRSLALDGAQVLHIVAEWPEARTGHWRTLQIARAIENQMYVVSANRVGEYDDVLFAGVSMAIDPWGDVLLEGSAEDEETLSISLDLEKVKTVRENVPIFTSRVPHLYKKEVMERGN
ncbi:carbon-nitrogen family hydrolase [Planomicrobium sp. Y74]|uniref:carbon-nitrogen family hydrolase n=1 Tax=Planomicrobium sp. Y74 TaxID=2478977 RepID=UPI000EF4753A|nr:carbon-nitrogen family hydrolase [Planomicrobium sp. Y74]RLQ90149.1 carbon-nitrogen family hydrolase [Planomicrobium sp. Y74]